MPKLNPKGLIRIKYSTGDTIFHPLHGIGEVKDFEKKELLGTEYIFAVLFFPRQQLKISLPANKLDETVRTPLTDQQARDILETAQETSEPLNSSWKVRNRKNLERLASGDPVQLITVLRGLHAIREEKGNLNNSDRKHLTQSLDLLSDEFSVAFGEPIEETRQRLEQTALSTVGAA